MSQVDNRNSSAAKRARTDGGRREDDWTCPSCGNVNFSFRTTCNMRNCTQSRPADHNGKSAPKHMQSPQSFSSPGRYLGSGGPPPVYMGGSPYGSSLFNGSMPPYDVPFSGGSPYHFNYSSRLPAGAHYRPLHMSGPPPPYHGGSMMGSGGMYGMPPPPMNRYGLGIAMGPAAAAAMMPRSGYYSDEKSQKRDSTRENDWTCPNCGNVNFSFRIVCNMRKCNTPKPGPPQVQQGGSSDQISKQKAPEGSWKCDNCGNINYPFRNKCNRQNCGADKPGDHSNESPSNAPEENDQIRHTSNGASDRCDYRLKNSSQGVDGTCDHREETEAKKGGRPYLFSHPNIA
ncbi:hypothetical protein BRARA_G02579 [Brassica rapa]|uniref:RanBP2-type domain-containing protein n=1 Tax=Brassica campestris TaxID=3711 RepID=A0A397YPU9_BRACM|nr:hypothetical protein BRARA_G02579 [Brassica rapa]